MIINTEGKNIFQQIYSTVKEVPEKVAGAVSGQIKTSFNDASSSVLEDLAKKMVDGVGELVVSLATLWMNVPTVKLTADDADAKVFNPTTDPIANKEAGIELFLGYTKYIALGICVLALIFAGTRMAMHRKMDSAEHGNRIGLILGAVILISAAGTIVSQLAIEFTDGSATVDFVRNELTYYTMTIALLSVIIAAAKMAWEQRADAGRDLMRSILTLVLVSGFSLTVITLLTQVADLASAEIIASALADDCQAADKRASCFGDSLLTLLYLSGINGSTIILLIL
ncbi:MAG: hypothetical protein ACRC0L_08015, partial [Angustibacter sp.]